MRNSPLREKEKSTVTEVGPSLQHEGTTPPSLSDSVREFRGNRKIAEELTERSSETAYLVFTWIFCQHIVDLRDHSSFPTVQVLGPVKPL